jgi:hypothetical protein
MPLAFEIATQPPAALPNRSDIACFVGFVARRQGVPLPQGVREALRTAGWARGRDGLPSSPWARDEDAVESLENLPVTVESWEAFASLFAWEKRPLRAVQSKDAGETGISFCATYLGAAVRSFFARGGKRAVIISVSDPWPYLEPDEQRAEHRFARLQRLVPDLPVEGGRTDSFDPTDPRRWGGVHHVYGLRELSLLCVPDLPDVCAVRAPTPATAVSPPVPAEGFVECSEDEPETQQDIGLHLIAAPRLESDSFVPWQLAVAHVRNFLAQNQREVVFVAALPLPYAEARSVAGGELVHAETDVLGFLRGAGVFEAVDEFEPGEDTIASAFVQLAYPWLRTRAGSDLPEGLEPADGVLVGLLSTNALARGTFRSVAGQFSVPRLNDVHGCVPSICWGAGSGGPFEQLAERVCLFARTPDGMTLQSDVTSSADVAWRFGGASRLMGTLLRAARRIGESVLYEGNGPVLWGRVRRGVEDLLTAFWRQGALAGASTGNAFSVRCDRSTMTQADIDNGRLLVEISLRPAASIVWITVVLDLDASGDAAGSLREVA